MSAPDPNLSAAFLQDLGALALPFHTAFPDTEPKSSVVISHVCVWSPARSWASAGTVSSIWYPWKAQHSISSVSVKWLSDYPEDLFTLLQTLENKNAESSRRFLKCTSLPCVRDLFQVIWQQMCPRISGIIEFIFPGLRKLRKGKRFTQLSFEVSSWILDKTYSTDPTPRAQQIPQSGENLVMVLSTGKRCSLWRNGSK